ncbi:MAG: hypothetical protein JKY36_02305, partial [Erythrobacter sp.]|nr:hypothetical protein [Erythrobacter sp.]
AEYIHAGPAIAGQSDIFVIWRSRQFVRVCTAFHPGNFLATAQIDLGECVPEFARYEERPGDLLA